MSKEYSAQDKRADSVACYSRRKRGETNMFQENMRRERRKNKWARAAGDHATVSAAGNEQTGRYIDDLDLEMAETIRFKPSQDQAQRVKSVRPSACAPWEEQPQLSGEVELNTGRAEVGYDAQKKDTVVSFVRHENDTQGREVQENRARVRNMQGRERFRSNDDSFSEGAMELRCDVARTSKTVLHRMGQMSSMEGGDTTMDRVLPFQKVGQERERVRQLRQMEHDSRDQRSQLHTAASGVAAFAGRKQQKQVEFRKKFAKAVEKARENRKTDDYQLYIRKKWEAMGKESPLWTSEMEQTLPWEQTPDTTADEDILFYSNQSEIDKE